MTFASVRFVTALVLPGLQIENIHFYAVLCVQVRLAFGSMACKSVHDKDKKNTLNVLRDVLFGFIWL